MLAKQSRRVSRSSGRPGGFVHTRRVTHTLRQAHFEWPGFPFDQKSRSKVYLPRPPRRSFPDECCKTESSHPAGQSARSWSPRLHKGQDQIASRQTARIHCEKMDRDSGNPPPNPPEQPARAAGNSCVAEQAEISFDWRYPPPHSWPQDRAVSATPPYPAPPRLLCLIFSASPLSASEPPCASSLHCFARASECRCKRQPPTSRWPIRVFGWRLSFALEYVSHAEVGNIRRICAQIQGRGPDPPVFHREHNIGSRLINEVYKTALIFRQRQRIVIRIASVLAQFVSVGIVQTVRAIELQLRRRFELQL